MFYRAAIMLTAGSCAAILSAQTPVQQPAIILRAPALTPAMDGAMRKLLKQHSQEASACSIPLIQVAPAGNPVPMPTVRPPADQADPMPQVKLPAPPCPEKLR
jgi:hypothetical protein